ncbi:hypothetical protein SESBI_12945 [Sesbania bispinosa]|nr:hypothetical protein SESBI_12945 [Sesbania bispinosa]
METPSSTARRVTRSQTTTLTGSNNIPKKIEDSEKNLSKTRQRNVQQQDRCALVDISNDSPIVGLANGDLETPLSSIAKQRGSRVKKTPGSGEALLRCQVKTLLQKVEEEAEISKLSMEIPLFLQFAKSPMSLLAPTPANTPQIPNIATGLATVSPSSVVQEQLISQVVNQIFDGKNQENPESENTLLSRSLLLDFSDKSEVSDCTSELTYQGGSSIEKPQGSTEDDGLNNISVNEKVAPKFAGKHTRFVYNSDDEVVEEVQVEGCAENASASSDDVLHLKGLPTPKGKHIRFPDEEEKSAF